MWKMLGVAGPTVRRMVKSLVERGFVMRFPAPSDRRERIVQLTEEGKKVMASAMAATMTSGKVEEAVVKAAGGKRRVRAFDGLLGVVRRGLGDRAWMLYLENPYASGWVPPPMRPLLDPLFEGP
jgi:DNA-binding MarR family transcriptional regulator